MSYENGIVRQKKRIIGVVAVVLLLLFTVLAFLGYLPFLLWIALDLVVAGLANLLLRRVDRKPV
jgi:hypothetical protein